MNRQDNLFSRLTTHNLLVIIVFVAIFTMAVRVPADTDTWWHLRSGQYVLENQTMFTTDPFSHTRTGQVWMYPKLGQVFWYSVFALGGWIGLSIVLALLVTVAFGLVWQVTPGNPFVRAFATILGVITSSLIWVVRPQMISFLLAGLLFMLLEWYKRKGSRWIYGLPVITVVWANVHGGYAIAFLMLAAYLIGETANRLTGHRDDPVLSWGQIGTLLGVGLVSFLVVAVNPHGWQLWKYPFQTIGIGALRNFIQEWQSPNFHQPITWPFIVMLLLNFVAMGAADRHADWSDLAMGGMWATLSFFAVRNVGFYGLLLVPALARYSQTNLEAYLPTVGRFSSKRSLIPIGFNWLVLGLVVLAASLRIGLTRSQIMTLGQQQNLPAGAVQFIQTEKPSGPLFNSYNWGGYLIFKLWPEYPVYIDGRTDLYEDKFIQRYLNVMTVAEGWQQILNDDGINMVLIENSTVLAKFLSGDANWKEIYRDDKAVVYARTKLIP